MNKKIVVTIGEPSGIGPDILLLALKNIRCSKEIIFFGDKFLIKQRLKILDINYSFYLKIFHIPLKKKCIPGVLNNQNSKYVIETLKKACFYCLKNKKSSILLTGPVHKGHLLKNNIKFFGHTEFLKKITNSENSLMVFKGNNNYLALATTHIPLKKVNQKITKKLLIKKLSIFNLGLKKIFNIKNSEIIVSGLNPHSGEYGKIGNEEIRTIKPVIKILKKKINILGPEPSDSIFITKNSNKKIFSMYHDQFLPVFKNIFKRKLINITFGLPIIRLSVDHGTALDLAGTRKVNFNNFIKCIKLSEKLLDKM